MNDNSIDRTKYVNAGSSALPLSAAVIYGNFIFCSGQVGRDATGNVPSDFGDQVRIALGNLKRVLEDSGTGPRGVLRTSVYLTRPEDAREMNAIYGDFFGHPAPARTTIVTQLVSPDLLFEVDAIAAPMMAVT
jgi:2-iminobutanoate/2-iminopropanoate deaminase